MCLHHLWAVLRMLTKMITLEVSSSRAWETKCLMCLMGFTRIYLPRAHYRLKAGFHMIADDRGSQIAKCSAIVCDHMETHLCDRLRSCDRDRRRSQKVEPCSIFCDRLRSFAIVCDQLRSCDHMETKVLLSAIETYPIIF